MKANISGWQLWGFLFTSLLGTILHFLFDLSGGSAVTALFSAVNESIWEHMKLIFYPMLIFAFIEYRVWGRGVPGFWGVKLCGIVLALVLIPALYYTYTGILGFSVDIVNILIFYITAALVFALETRLMKSGKALPIPAPMAVVVLCVIAAIFTLFTFRPPQIALFRDPMSGGYGFFDA